jgi:hypothetical protein
LTKLLRNEFKGFMDGRSLQLLGTTADHYIVRDTVYQIDSYHDFPLTVDPTRWSEPYPMFKDKMTRRIKRFMETIRSAPVCFVRLEASRAEAQELELALRRLTRQPFLLLVVNVKRTLSPKPAWEEWELRRVRSVTVPAGFDWRGSDQAWDTVMRDFTLI